jgi:DNA-directed RNA polymerase subunit RPC12/RpoP
MSYIEREAFLAEQRHLYCENCARCKNGKGKFVYDIGDAPCRACDIMDVLDAVEDAPAADVRPVVKAFWIGEGDGYADGEMVYDVWSCSNCGYTVDEGDNEPPRYNFCPNCGAKMEESR